MNKIVPHLAKAERLQQQSHFLQRHLHIKCRKWIPLPISMHCTPLLYIRFRSLCTKGSTFVTSLNAASGSIFLNAYFHHTRSARTELSGLPGLCGSPCRHSHPQLLCQDANLSSPPKIQALNCFYAFLASNPTFGIRFLLFFLLI